MAPDEPVAVRVYVVSVVGWTVTEFPVTTPAPLSMLIETALATVQLKVLAWLLVIVAGDAVKEVIDGGGTTETDAVAEVVWPVASLAVNV